MTVVAFGTSAPELAVSVNSALTPGDTAIQLALGNVIGSNLFNVLVILGMSAVVAPLVVERQLIRLDVPVLIFTSVLCYLLALWGGLRNVLEADSWRAYLAASSAVVAFMALTAQPLTYVVAGLYWLTVGMALARPRAVTGEISEGT